MLLEELFAKDIDLSEYDKKLLVNIKLAEPDGLNIKSLYSMEENTSNLKKSKEELLNYGFIEETDKKDFYVLTDVGIESMKRSSLLDSNDELNDTHASKYYYDTDES